MKYFQAGMLVGLALVYSPLPVAQQPAPVVTVQSTQERLERLERRVKSLTEMMLHIDRLQQEMRELRGEVEVQAHAVETMRKRQRDLYLDIDQRLSRLSSGPSAQASPGTGTAMPGASSNEQPADPAAPPARPGAAASPGQISPPPIKTVDPAGEERAYQQAFDLLKQGQYAESISAFNAFLGKYPAGNYADNAQYWLGEANYVSREFDTAFAEFEKVITLHPYSPKVPGALLKTGFIEYERQNWAQARKILEELRKKYPASTESRLAKKRLDRMRAKGH